MRATIVGGGAIGSAIRLLLQEAGLEVVAWDADPSRRTAGVATAAQACADAAFVFYCLPTWVLDAALNETLPHVPKRAALISVSKGMERGTALFMDEVFARRGGRRPFCLLSGPMLADEIAGGKGGAALVAGTKALIAKELVALFHGTGLRAEASKDVRGAAVCGVLKNVYAIGLGAADALGWGQNRKGWYLGEATREMTRLMSVLGGRAETALSPAGLGDLSATGLSPLSKNRTLGADLVKTGTCEINSEGCAALPMLEQRLGSRLSAFPVLRAVADAVAGRRHAKEALEAAFLGV